MDDEFSAETAKFPRLSSDSSESLRNFSPILSSCFSQELTHLHSYLYRINSSKLFGILLPINYPPTSLLTFLNLTLLEIDAQSLLRRFQHELWSDLFYSSKDPIGRVSEANYFVVPLLEDDTIDWAIINRAVGKSPGLVLSDIMLSSRNDILLKSTHRGGVIWKYVQEINSTSTVSEFLERLYGRDYGKLRESVEKYKGFDPMDIIFDEKFACPPAKDLRNLVAVGIVKEFNESSQIVFLKRLKSVRMKSTENVNSKYNKGFPMFPAELLEVFYLTYSHWIQSKSLLESLIEIESSSYVLDLCSKLKFTGDFDIMRQSTVSPFLNSTANNIPFSLIGKSLLEIIYQINATCSNNPQEIDSENIVSRKILTVIQDLELKYYVKTRSLSIINFRPAFYASKETILETYSLEHRLSEKLLVEFVYAIIGVYVIACGAYSAGEMLVQINALDPEVWENASLFITDISLTVTSADTEKLSTPNIPQNLLILDQNSLEDIIDYKFQDTDQLAFIRKIFSQSQNNNYKILGKSF